MKDCDPYPDETKWREQLPEKSCLHYLDYGIMSEMIVDKVKQKQKEVYIFKVTQIIHQLSHVQLNNMNEKIKAIEPWLESTKINWTHSRRKKQLRINWYIENRLSIDFLKDQLMIVNNGPPIIDKYDRVVKKVKIKGIDYYSRYVIETGNRENNPKWVYGYEIYDRKLKNGDELVDWNRYFIYDEFRYYKYESNYFVQKPKLVKLDPWTIKVIGKEKTDNNDIKRKQNQKSYEIDYKTRIDVWNRYLSPLFDRNIPGAIHNSCIIKSSWFWPRIPVWIIKEPPCAKHSSENMKLRWENEWMTVIKIIANLRESGLLTDTNRLVDEKEEDAKWSRPFYAV